ncbi:hypothetical protein CRENBAI_014075 [Crenichthys baileyi]|uniref:V-SNARE coiled-coil homology domain-containing protein n=1 Tax=Crenichthys baileyi TaxID=28760 RepID=A0AAV9RRK5_9TELE
MDFMDFTEGEGLSNQTLTLMPHLNLPFLTAPEGSISNDSTWCYSSWLHTLQTRNYSSEVVQEEAIFTMSAASPEGSAPASSNKRLQQTQAQVDEVVDIMRVNVDKVLERDQKLSELDDRADALQAGASQFETSAAKLKRKYWWKNCKMWAILIAVLVIIIIIIIIWSSTK